MFHRKTGSLLTPCRLVRKDRKKRERAKESKTDVKRQITSKKKKKKGALAVAQSVWGMALHLGSSTAEAVSVSAATLIIYHPMPRSNWTNNLYEDLGNSSHFQPRGVNRKSYEGESCEAREGGKKALDPHHQL